MSGPASHVNVWVGAKRKEAIVIPTDRNGTARLQLTLKPDEINITSPSNERGSIVENKPVVNYEAKE